MQFFTVGCFNGIIGYIMFYKCSSFNPYHSMEEAKECIDSGPGVQMNLEMDVISLVLQFLLTWISFVFVFCAKPKGRPKFKYQSLSEKQKKEKIQKSEKICCCCVFDPAKGGRLKFFMIYDLVVFAICVGLLFLFTFVKGTDMASDLWRVKSHVYFVRIIYGLLSFPFLIFLLPFLQNILTKSRPTAYDRRGNCVPLQLESFIVKSPPKDYKENADQSEITKIITSASINELLD